MLLLNKLPLHAKLLLFPVPKSLVTSANPIFLPLSSPVAVTYKHYFCHKDAPLCFSCFIIHVNGVCGKINTIKRLQYLRQTNKALKDWFFKASLNVDTFYFNLSAKLS